MKKKQAANVQGKTKSLKTEICCGGIGFWSNFKAFFRQHTRLINTVFAGAKKSGGPMGGCKFGGNIPINVTKDYSVYEKHFKVVRLLISGDWSLSFLYRYCVKQVASQSKCLEVRKTVSFIMQMKNWVWQSLVQFWVKILEALLAMILRWSCKKRPHKPEIAHSNFSTDTLTILIDLIEHNIVGFTKLLLFHCYLFFSKRKVRQIESSGFHNNHQTLS